MPTTRISIGKRGEEIARRHLARLGYEIVCSNYRRREGEIDIIAHDGETLVFVEVRSHSTPEFGTPAESIIRSKLEKIETVATLYMQETECEDIPCRFDAVEVYFKRGRLQRINHIQNIAD